jgi:hypothetical protein
MALTHTITRQYKDTSGIAIQLTETPTGNAENNFDDTLPVAANTAKVWNVVRANLKSLVLFSDLGVTVKTNSSGSPTDTIVLQPGQALCWTLATDLLAKCPFSADVTAGLFITNTAAGPAIVKIRALLSE